MITIYKCPECEMLNVCGGLTNIEKYCDGLHMIRGLGGSGVRYSYEHQLRIPGKLLPGLKLHKKIRMEPIHVEYCAGCGGRFIEEQAAHIVKYRSRYYHIDCI